MSFFIDFVVLAIIALSVIVYVKRGLVGVIIDIAGFILSALVAWYFSPMIGGYLSGIIRKSVPDGDGIIEDILTSDVLARIIAFTIVFIVCMIVVKFIVKLTKNIKIPIVSGIDKLLGGVLGLILGLAWAQIASIMIFAVLKILANILPSFSEEALEGLKVTRWFFENNIFRSMFNI